MKNFISFQVVSKSEIEKLKDILKKDNITEIEAFLIFNILTKLFISMPNKISPVIENFFIKNKFISFKCYSEKNPIDDIQIDDTQNSEELEKLLEYLDLILKQNYEYFQISDNLKSFPAKFLFLYLYRTFSNYLNPKFKASQKNFDFTISVLDLFLLLKGKTYDKYDKNFDRFLEKIISEINNNTYNKKFKITTNKINNKSSHGYSKFYNHSYSFTITFNPQEENKKEE
jgi:hypothetical protein